METTRRHALVGLGLLAARAVMEAGQAPSTAYPRPFLRGFTFGSPASTGSFGAAILEQPGCPLAVQVTRLNRSGSVVTLSMRLNNVGESNVARQVVGAWVLLPDGTVRGHQKWVGERDIEPAKYRGVDVPMRTELLRDDVIVVAVLEVAGDEAAPWRRDVKDLERELREAIAAGVASPLQ